MIAHLPNALTLLRIVLVPLIIWFIVGGDHGAAFAVFAIAGITDMVDGALARGFGWHSRLGAYLDPLADKALLASCFVALGYGGAIPLWLVVIVVGRDAAILAGVAVLQAMRRALVIRPMLISKVNTAVQVMYVALVLLSAGLIAVPGSILTGASLVTAGLTIGSWAAYAGVFGRALVGPAMPGVLGSDDERAHAERSAELTKPS
ncbi:MAG: CDP-alcohol phosphatidyltransferase family protein [Alphaproteobacteria bacterium]|nr:CDP-alcohol phosphatidyltransferase family protein [Alphaproteobacteria bacterium]